MPCKYINITKDIILFEEDDNIKYSIGKNGILVNNNKFIYVKHNCNKTNIVVSTPLIHKSLNKSIEQVIKEVVTKLNQ